MVDKEFLGHICTLMQLNELEIIVWCYTIYLLLIDENTFGDIRENKGGMEPSIMFCHPDELVLASAIFAKFSACGLDDRHTNMVIGEIGLKKDMVISFYKELEVLIDDPIAMDRFYLEMRLINDPEMSKHAEDYNLMVLDMVKKTEGSRPGLGGVNTLAPQHSGTYQGGANGSSR
jgi:hypothetical protein